MWLEFKSGAEVWFAIKILRHHDIIRDREYVFVKVRDLKTNGVVVHSMGYYMHFSDNESYTFAKMAVQGN